jgi:hypothetical protein
LKEAIQLAKAILKFHMAQKKVSKWKLKPQKVCNAGKKKDLFKSRFIYSWRNGTFIFYSINAFLLLLQVAKRIVFVFSSG